MTAKIKLGFIVFLLTTFIGGSTISFASVLEEVIVTAQKREQNVQDIGIAITAMTGDQMDALGYNSAQHVTTMAPGVHTVQPNGEANYSIAIRGSANSDFTTNQESPVAIYLDGVYVSQMSGTGFSLFDMERVEILRGPQGTLYGRNATGGLAHFISKKPTRETEGYAKATVGEYSQFKFEGAISGPIGETASARLSVSTHNNDGYITNRLGEDLNNADDQSVRLQFLWNPSDDIEFLLSLRGSQQDIRTGFFEHVSAVGAPGEYTPNEVNYVLGYIDNDGDVYAGDYDDPGFNDLETRGYSGTLTWDFGNMKLTSITDFSTVERDYIEDSDASPAPVFDFFLVTDSEQFSQEIRLDGETDSMKWTAGVYYLDLDINDANGAITDPFVGPAPTPGAEAGLFNPYRSEVQSMSVFGQVEFAIADNVNMTIGGRVVRDDRDFAFSVDVVEFINPDPAMFNVPSNRNLLAPLATYAASREDTEWAARLGLDWTLSDDTLVYTSWNRGVKTSGYNAPIFPLSPPNDYDDATMSFDPEIVDAFEVGVKLSTPDGRARLNAAMYYNDFDNYQAFTITGLDTLLKNSTADSKGFEVELMANPTDGLDILLGVAYNETDLTLGDGFRTGPVQSPKWNANAMVRYEWSLASGATVALQGDMHYRSKHIFALPNLPANREDGYTIGNVFLTYTTADQAWVASAFVENVTGEEHLVQTFDLSTDALFGMIEQYYNRPKWAGVSLRYNF